LTEATKCATIASVTNLDNLEITMKIQITTPPTSERRLMAVLGSAGEGMWIRGNTGPNVYLCTLGSSPSFYHTLEAALGSSSLNTPIYEGDTISITF
jgi:hypothetical protein